MTSNPTRKNLEDLIAGYEILKKQAMVHY